jgi:hypothetical protein
VYSAKLCGESTAIPIAIMIGTSRLFEILLARMKTTAVARLAITEIIIGEFIGYLLKRKKMGSEKNYYYY